jgi:hypothetical protein
MKKYFSINVFVGDLDYGYVVAAFVFNNLFVQPQQTLFHQVHFLYLGIFLLLPSLSLSLSSPLFFSSILFLHRPYHSILLSLFLFTFLIPFSPLSFYLSLSFFHLSLLPSLFLSFYILRSLKLHTYSQSWTMPLHLQPQRPILVTCDNKFKYSPRIFCVIVHNKLGYQCISWLSVLS